MFFTIRQGNVKTSYKKTIKAVKEWQGGLTGYILFMKINGQEVIGIHY